MRFSISHPASLAAVCLLTCITPTLSHSWVEELYLVSSNGSYVGAPGYVRNFIPRTSPSFSDTAAEHKVPPDGRPTGSEILTTDTMCRSAQTLGSQSSGYPALNAAPQDNIAMRFDENGHVTLFTTQKGKPAGRGTVYVYGTSNSLATDTYLGIHRVWNTEGTGGDKRGKLLSTSQFDDGRCFQVNSSPLAASRAKALGMTSMAEVPCQAAVQLPSDAPTSGLYTLYWVWEWPTIDNTGKVVTNESYTSCMDVSMQAKSSVDTDGKFEVAQAVASNADSLAIQAQLNNQFLVDPTAGPTPAPDNPLTGAPAASPAASPAPFVPTGNPAVATATAAPVTSSAQAAPSVAANPTPAVGAVVTVTVTEQEHYTVTVTRDAPSGAATISSAAASSTSISTSVQPPTTLQTSASSTTTFTFISEAAGAYPTQTSVPAVVPFLAAGSSIVAEPSPKPRLMRIRGRAVV